MPTEGEQNWATVESGCLRLLVFNRTRRVWITQY